MRSSNRAILGRPERLLATSRLQPEKVRVRESCDQRRAIEGSRLESSVELRGRGPWAWLRRRSGEKQPAHSCLSPSAIVTFAIDKRMPIAGRLHAVQLGVQRPLL